MKLASISARRSSAGFESVMELTSATGDRSRRGTREAVPGPEITVQFDAANTSMGTEMLPSTLDCDCKGSFEANLLGWPALDCNDSCCSVGECC